MKLTKKQWIITGIVSAVLFSGVVYLAIPEQIKNPVGYMKKQEERRNTLEQDLTKFKEESKLLKEKVSKIDNEIGRDGRYKETQRVDIQELDKLVSEIKNLESKFSFTFTDKEVETFKKSRSEKISQFEDKLKTLEDSADQYVAKLKDELAQKVKKEDERKAQIKRVNENYEKSGLNIPQEESGLKATVLSRTVTKQDDTGEELSWGEHFQRLVVQIENTGSEDKIITNQMFKGFLENNHWNDKETMSKSHFKEHINLSEASVTLKPKESKTFNVVFATLNPQSYSGYDIVELVISENGVADDDAKDYKPLFRFKTK